MIVSFLNSAYDWLLGSTYAIYETNDAEKKVIFEFDTIEEVLFRATSNVTSYPIERGYMATDYKYLNPCTVQIKAVISRNSSVGKKVFSLLKKSDVVEKLKTTLEYYRSGIYALNIKTKTGIRENYTLQDYEIPENYDNFGVIEVLMTFTQIMDTQRESLTLDPDKNTLAAGIVRLLGLN